MRSTPLFKIVVGTALLATFAAAGCGHDEDVPAGLSDVLFEGDASDEAWIAIEEAYTSDDPEGSAWTFGPTTFLADGSAESFTWARVAVTHRAPRHHALPPLRREETRSDRFARGLSELLFPVAHAHLPPVTGTVYRLIFSVPGQSAPLRVLTTDRSYTPAGAALSKLDAATGPITLELVHTYLVDNRVMEGPYRLPAITITPQ